MNNLSRRKLQDGFLTLGLLTLAFLTAMTVDSLFEAQPLIPLFFVLAVFWVSQLTEGYFWGIASSLFSVLAVNFVFTYPFFAFDFEVVENLVSAVIIMVVSISTCTLTQKRRRHEMLKAEFDKEKMRGSLLRGVSHDLRTPLTAIYGASSTISENYDLLSDEDKKQMLKGIQEDSQWLIRMVENLLSITKMVNEHVKLSKFPVVVEELVGTALERRAGTRLKALIGFLMFGNLIRECGVLNSLSETAQNALANLITIFLGITIALRMQANEFLAAETLLILGLGLVAFIFDTAGGVLFAKVLNLFLKNKINPMIGAAGISAFPMSGRVVHKMGLAEDPQNFLLMHSIGVNVSGQIASVIAGGLILNFFL